MYPDSHTFSLQKESVADNKVRCDQQMFYEHFLNNSWSKLNVDGTQKDFIKLLSGIKRLFKEGWVAFTVWGEWSKIKFADAVICGHSLQTLQNNLRINAFVCFETNDLRIVLLTYCTLGTRIILYLCFYAHYNAW